MPSISGQQAAIMHTEQGLSIAGTRITIYDIMTHLKAGWTPRLIQNWLPLTEEQLNAALTYIETNPAEVEAEYQSVLNEAQATRQYWENTNRERFAQIAKMPLKPGQEEIHAKLQAWKTKLHLT